ncbi:ComF family protein [Planctomycetota bacterium]
MWLRPQGVSAGKLLTGENSSGSKMRPGCESRRLAVKRFGSWNRLFLGTSRDLLFPPECSFCQVPVRSNARYGLCEECRIELCVDAHAEFCVGCGTLSLANVFGLSKCPECDKRDYRFDEIVPLGIFRGRLRDAMIRMKNAGEAPLSRSIALLTAEAVNLRIGDDLPDIVVSIPKYWAKRLLKGTNGAELLGEDVAKFLDVPFFPRTLRWTRNIRKQSLLSVTERARNVRGALKLSSGFDVRDAHVLIVDDTMTTGATANEAAIVFKRCGVRRTTVAVAARASNLDTLDSVDLETSFAKATKIPA